MGNAYDNASLIVTPNAYKASKIYSLKPDDGSGDLAFSRAGSKMVRNSSGLWETIGTNIPPLSYPVGGGCPSWLFEADAENEVLYSTDFSNGVWGVAGGATKTASALSSNIIGVTAYDIVFNGSGYLAQFGLSTTSGTYYTLFVKASVIGDVGSTIQFGSLASVSAITLTSDWQEVIFQKNIDGGVQLIAGTADKCTITYIGAGDYSTSPIITAGGSVTRLADDASKTGISALIGQTEGTMYWEGNLPQDQTATAKYLLQLYGASPAITITTYSNVINIISSPIDASSVFTAGVYAKIAVCYNDSGNFRIFVNGAKTHDLNTFVGAARTSLAYGVRGGAGDSQPNTTCKEAILYNTALSDSEAIALTTL